MATEQDHWDACPPGELTKTVQTRLSRRRRQAIDRVAMAAASLMVLIAVVGFTLGMFTTDPADPLAGLTCATVAESMPAYIAGEVEPAMHDRLATHIKNCPSCQSHYQQLMGGISSLARSAILFAA